MENSSSIATAARGDQLAGKVKGGETLLIGPAPLIIVCVAIMIHPAVRCGWRVGLSLAVV